MTPDPFTLSAAASLLRVVDVPECVGLVPDTVVVGVVVGWSAAADENLEQEEVAAGGC